MKRYQLAIRNILTIIVLQGLLLSCGVYTRYKRPEHALYGLDSLYRTENRPDTGVPLDLLARRPDVRQAKARLMQAFYATNAARSAFYPSITLSGTAGWTNSGGTAITNPGAWLLQAVGSLVQPLFQRGENLANLKIAKAQQEETL